MSDPTAVRPDWSQFPASASTMIRDFDGRRMETLVTYGGPPGEPNNIVRVALMDSNVWNHFALTDDCVSPGVNVSIVSPFRSDPNSLVVPILTEQAFYIVGGRDSYDAPESILKFTFTNFTVEEAVPLDPVAEPLAQDVLSSVMATDASGTGQYLVMLREMGTPGIVLQQMGIHGPEKNRMGPVTPIRQLSALIRHSMALAYNHSQPERGQVVIMPFVPTVSTGTTKAVNRLFFCELTGPGLKTYNCTHEDCNALPTELIEQLVKLVCSDLQDNGPILLYSYQRGVGWASVSLDSTPAVPTTTVYNGVALYRGPSIHTVDVYALVVGGRDPALNQTTAAVHLYNVQDNAWALAIPMCQTNPDSPPRPLFPQSRTNRTTHGRWPSPCDNAWTLDIPMNLGENPALVQAARWGHTLETVGTVTAGWTDDFGNPVTDSIWVLGGVGVTPANWVLQANITAHTWSRPAVSGPEDWRPPAGMADEDTTSGILTAHLAFFGGSISFNQTTTSADSRDPLPNTTASAPIRPTLQMLSFPPGLDVALINCLSSSAEERTTEDRKGYPPIVRWDMMALPGVPQRSRHLMKRIGKGLAVWGGDNIQVGTLGTGRGLEGDDVDNDVHDDVDNDVHDDVDNDVHDVVDNDVHDVHDDVDHDVHDVHDDVDNDVHDDVAVVAVDEADRERRGWPWRPRVRTAHQPDAFLCIDEYVYTHAGDAWQLTPLASLSDDDPAFESTCDYSWIRYGNEWYCDTARSAQGCGTAGPWTGPGGVEAPRGYVAVAAHKLNLGTVGAPKPTTAAGGIKVAMAEWLRRETRNLLGLPRVGFVAHLHGANSLVTLGGAVAASFQGLVPTLAAMNASSSIHLLTSCPSGTAPSSSGACVACGPGYYMGSDQDVCQQCPGGRYQIYAGTPICRPCPAGPFEQRGSAGLAGLSFLADGMDGYGQVGVRRCLAELFAGWVLLGGVLIGWVPLPAFSCRFGSLALHHTGAFIVSASSCLASTIPPFAGTYNPTLGAKTATACTNCPVADAIYTDTYVPATTHLLGVSHLQVRSKLINIIDILCSFIKLIQRSSKFIQNIIDNRTHTPQGTYASDARDSMDKCDLCPAGTLGLDMGATGSETCADCPRTNTTTQFCGLGAVGVTTMPPHVPSNTFLPPPASVQTHGHQEFPLTHLTRAEPFEVCAFPSFTGIVDVPSEDELALYLALGCIGGVLIAGLSGLLLVRCCCYPGRGREFRKAVSVLDMFPILRNEIHPPDMRVQASSAWGAAVLFLMAGCMIFFLVYQIVLGTYPYNQVITHSLIEGLDQNLTSAAAVLTVTSLGHHGPCLAPNPSFPGQCDPALKLETSMGDVSTPSCALLEDEHTCRLTVIYTLDTLANNDVTVSCEANHVFNYGWGLDLVIGNSTFRRLISPAAAPSAPRTDEAGALVFRGELYSVVTLALTQVQFNATQLGRSWLAILGNQNADPRALQSYWRIEVIGAPRSGSVADRYSFAQAPSRLALGMQFLMNGYHSEYRVTNKMQIMTFIMGLVSTLPGVMNAVRALKTTTEKAEKFLQKKYRQHMAKKAGRAAEKNQRPGHSIAMISVKQPPTPPPPMSATSPSTPGSISSPGATTPYLPPIPQTSQNPLLMRAMQSL
ncbi:hypothetical protein PAPYR_9194 [Paratrimastix pyriformis]|uniref:Tyrosine-protein kinase ephrin type A/B receptor-like domain-containing protein n=1 Tax=Paratrimastix pyriformis TaxID=342808 RepID=A0ABQ8UAJ2_9EUKA|nr:hypothetical protein PAPYR_9194 [Paratrimastix pyriformis]